MTDEEHGARKRRDQMTSALERWEEEGGALVSQLAVRSNGGEPGEVENRVLESLGAAVVSMWNELPTDIQRAVFRQAAANKTHDPVRLRAQIARFLHGHKDDADSG
jgi:hypothetical protein